LTVWLAKVKVVGVDMVILVWRLMAKPGQFKGMRRHDGTGDVARDTSSQM